MNTYVKFTIKGNPIPKARMTYKSKWTKSAKRTLEYQSYVGLCYQTFCKEYFENDIFLYAIFYRADKRKVDADNLYKSLADGLNKIAYKDDSQIVHNECLKLYDKENPRTEVELGVFTDSMLKEILERKAQHLSTSV